MDTKEKWKETGKRSNGPTNISDVMRKQKDITRVRSGEEK